MRKFAFSYYTATGVIVFFLFISILRRISFTPSEFFAWAILGGLIIFTIVAAWRAKNNGR